MFRTFAALALAAGIAAPAAAALPPPVARALAAAKVPRTAVAVLVEPVGGSRPLLSERAGAALDPGSVMKLVTTFAALEQLGPAYRWRTEAWATGPLRDGVLEGNLVLRGSGDPKLDLEAFWGLLRALRGQGLREIRGDLVLDRSRFAPVDGDPNAFDGEGFRPYNVLPDALLLNYRSLRFVFQPVPERGTASVYVDPRPPALEVVNRLRLSAGPCLEGKAFRELLQAAFDSARQRAEFDGLYPAACGEKDLNVALLSPDDQVAGVMRQLWGELGGAWQGAVRDGALGADAQLLHAHESAPLANLVRDMNKYSNNVMARQIFLTLGAEASGAPATLENSRAAVKSLLAAHNIAAPELVLDNGSGLSRTARVSAATLAALLQAAWKSALMPEFVASLPIVAVDGTERKRMKDDDAAGRAHIKSGLLADASAIAGYMLSRSGRRYVVVMIANGPGAPEARVAMDALLHWVYER